jgi:muramoyltetrapeptide carboxypeptidase
MKIKPLVLGSKIYITSPAKAIDAECVFNAKSFLENNGFEVVIAEHCLGNHHYFSGTDEERLMDMQHALDDDSITAIWCARGGYGAVRIVDRLNWSNFQSNPKWLIGFSDITVFHNRLNSYNIPSIHATMPLNLNTNSTAAKVSFLDAINGHKLSYNLSSCRENIYGNTKGILVGGNLSILYSLLATNDNIDFTEKILFIEDVGEQLYNLDRMLFTFEKAGVLDKIKGLVVGGFTDLKDTATPFGQGYKEIIASKFLNKNIPVAFDFPAGHIDDNRALVFGFEYYLEVSENEVNLKQV